MPEGKRGGRLNEEMIIRAIGRIHSPFKEAAGTPVQSPMADRVRGAAELFPEYADGLRDLEGFERIRLLYWFDQAAPARLTVRPFLHDAEHGIFATRAPCRPNPIGISCVRLLEIKGNFLEVDGVDVLDNTPLLDIEPYSPRFDVFEVTRSGWLDQAKPGSRVADDRFSPPRKE
jgi:tRNA-Thr(GGU) m(6)t(6)A37 methyltransferase TsaA